MRRQVIIRIISAILAISLVGCGNENIVPSESVIDESSQEEVSIPPQSPETVETEKIETVSKSESAVESEEIFDDSQKNSIAMLNYLAALSQEINSSSNSRMFLEEAYASLINNTNPENVNDLTESHLSSLLDTIEKYRMIDVKRERLEKIYNQNKAEALREAIPNPIALLSAASSLNVKRAILSSIYMAIDSVTSYNKYNSSLDQEFLRDGWVLDDEASENLHDSRTRAFKYMIEIVREENLPGELALSEHAIEQFVDYTKEENIQRKLQFLESELETYKFFGNYWLELADCYYELEKYDKCLESINMYEDLQSDIFRKDYYYANELPKVIVAAAEVLDGEHYINEAERYVELLISNTENTDWSLRYLAAQVYVDLYVRTNDIKYLNYAYKIVLNNINYLVDEQYKMNDEFMSDVVEIEIPEDATKEEKKSIKNYNKSLHEIRKTALPPVYGPLTLNCDLLFSLAEKLDISSEEKERINGILYGNDPLFLSELLRNKYSFNREQSTLKIDFDGEDIILPIAAMSENSKIKLIVNEGSKEKVYDNWVVKEVDRVEDNFNDSSVKLINEDIEEQEWTPESKVRIIIYTNGYSDENINIFNFKLNNVKNRFVLPDSLDFVQVI